MVGAGTPEVGGDVYSGLECVAGGGRGGYGRDRDRDI